MVSRIYSPGNKFRRGPLLRDPLMPRLLRVLRRRLHVWHVWHVVRRDVGRHLMWVRVPLMPRLVRVPLMPWLLRVLHWRLRVWHVRHVVRRDVGRHLMHLMSVSRLLPLLRLMRLLRLLPLRLLRQVSLMHLMLMLSLLRVRVLRLGELLRRARELRRRSGEHRRVPSSPAGVRHARGRVGRLRWAWSCRHCIPILEHSTPLVGTVGRRLGHRWRLKARQRRLCRPCVRPRVESGQSGMCRRRRGGNSLLIGSHAGTRSTLVMQSRLQVIRRGQNGLRARIRSIADRVESRAARLVGSVHFCRLLLLFRQCNILLCRRRLSWIRTLW